MVDDVIHGKMTTYPICLVKSIYRCSEGDVMRQTDKTETTNEHVSLLKVFMRFFRRFTRMNLTFSRYSASRIIGSLQ